MDIRPLRSPDEFQRYIDFAHEVYRDHPQWVPPFADHLLELLAGQTNAGPHWDVQPFWVYPQFSQMEKVLAEEVQSILIGKKNPKEALTSARDRMNALIK